MPGSIMGPVNRYGIKMTPVTIFQSIFASCSLVSNLVFNTQSASTVLSG